MTKKDLMGKFVEVIQENILNTESVEVNISMTRYALGIRNASYGSKSFDFSSLNTAVNNIFVGFDVANTGCIIHSSLSIVVKYKEFPVTAIPVKFTTAVDPIQVSVLTHGEFWETVADAAVRLALVQIISDLKQKRANEVAEFYDEHITELQTFLEEQVKKMQDALDEMQLPYVLKLERKVKK